MFKRSAFWTVLILFMATVLFPPVCLAENVQLKLLEPSSFPSLISSVRLDIPIDFCGERVPLDIPDVRERVEKEILISLWNRYQVVLWLKRAGRYMPVIDKMLKENGMPLDLKYVAVVESALLPHVGSRKGAIGFWQFISSTGKRFGLEINSYVDERRNIFYSTEAAIKYFKKLYQIFGNWTLSAAAYNMGEDRLKREIEKQGVNDYYKLYLFIETQRYIPKIIAAKTIMSNPEKFGFWLDENDLYPPLTYDRVGVDCSGRTHLRTIARAANTYYKIIKDMNPEIRGSYLPRGNHVILIPDGQSKGFHARLDRYYQNWLAKKNAPQPRKKKNNSKKLHPKHIYVVKKGDNLSIIADKFGVPVSSIVRWNRLKSSNYIHPGDRLIIYKKNN